VLNQCFAEVQLLDVPKHMNRQSVTEYQAGANPLINIIVLISIVSTTFVFMNNK